MQNDEAEGKALLSAAVERSENLVAKLPSGSTFTLLDNSFQDSWKSFSDKGQFRSVLEAVDFSAAYRKTGSVLSRLTEQPAEPVSQTIFWNSDFQRSSFDPEDLWQIGKQQKLFLIPVLPGQIQNVFVDSVAVEDEFIRAGESSKLVAYLRNAGDKEVNSNVKFYLGQSQTGALDVSLEPGSSSSISFSFRLQDPGLNLCRIAVEDYPVVFDNEYFFTLQVSPPIRILNFGDKRFPGVADVYSNEPIFRLQSASAADVSYKEVESADLIVLNGVEQIDEALANNVKQQIQQGAAVLVIPAAKIDGNAYQRLFSVLQLPVVAAAGSERLAVAPPDAADPFFKNVFEKLPRDIETPAANPVLKWSRASRDLLKFRNGSPFLSEFRLGRGRVFLMAASLAPENSSLASNALFVPVMYKLAMFSLRSSQPLSYSFRDRALSLPVPENAAKEIIYKIRRDSVEWIPEQRLANGALSLTMPAEIMEAGFYELVNPDGQAVKTLAFNYDKRESLLESYSPAELKELMREYPNVQVFDPAAGVSFSEQFSKDNFGTPLWKYCLLLCLLALAAEIAVIRFL